MLRKIFSVFILSLLLIACTITFSACSFSNQIYLPEENTDYTINNYNVEIIVDKDKTLTIKEKITATFTEPYKGIVRYIPTTETIGEVDENGNIINSKNYVNTIFDFEYDKENSTSGTQLIKRYSDNGYEFFYLGSYSNFVGTKTFAFSYKLNPGDDRDTEKDSFYFNIIGTGWDTKIENLSWQITFPYSVENWDYYIYQGRVGEDAIGEKLLLNGNTISSSATNLDYGEAITLKLDFEQGYFSFDRNLTFDYVLLACFLILTIAIIILFVRYKKKEPIVDVVEFSAPDNLTPTEAGFIYDGATQGKDLASLIVYWADKGYLNIIDNGNKNCELKKVNNLPETAKIHEKIYFNSLFENRETVQIKNLGIKEGNAALSAKKSVDSTKNIYFLNTGKYIFQILNFLVLAFNIACGLRLGFEAHSFWLGTSRIAIAIVICLIINSRLINIELEKTKKLITRVFKYILYSLVFIGSYLVNILYTETYCDPMLSRFYFIILSIILFITIAHLEYRTKKGREILGKLNGLKRYIELAEKDRLEALVKDDPKIFYHILPYAYVLGVSDIYIKKFENIPIASPEFVVSTSPISTLLTISFLNRNLNIISQSLTNYLPSVSKSIIRTVGSATLSSGGHIGRGGGFSGGGFGGGGGGAFR